MIIRAIILLMMILWDASLHWFEVINKTDLHPLYPIFPLFGIIGYKIFWSIFWSIGALLILSIVIKNAKTTKTF